jgi:hypothetical protein
MKAEDMRQIKSLIQEAISIHPDVIKGLWGDFSEEWYCAGSISCNEHTMKHFREYLATGTRVFNEKEPDARGV